MEKKTDLRIIKTRRQIQTAFLNLLKENKFDTISVSQITQEAMISRSTFYDHYEDKFALLDSIYEMINSEFKKIVTDYFSKEDRDFNMELAHKILTYVMKNAGMFKILMSANVPVRDLFMPLKDILQPYCMEYLEKHPNKYKLDSEFVVEVYSSIIFISFRWIVLHENPMDVVKIVAMGDQVRKMFYE